MALALSGTSNGSLNNLSLSGNTATIVDTGRAGGIIQVVQATTATQVLNTSSTLADTGLSATITPTSSSNKILVIVQQSGCQKDSANTYGELSLIRGSTLIATFENQFGYNATNTTICVGTCGGQYLDSPATTSATTYKTQFNSQNNTGRVFVQVGNDRSSITLLEVVA